MTMPYIPGAYYSGVPATKNKAAFKGGTIYGSYTQPKVNTYTPPGGPQSYAPSTPETQPLAAALNYSHQGTALPAYDPQAYNVNLPTIDWSFNPTEAQRGGWQTQATATAAQEIDPQLLSLKAALDQYMTQGQNIRGELNPRYTGQSLGIANWIQNSVKQEAIDSAIRRGAETSGWLPKQLMEAGYKEAGMRSDIETQRNQELSKLAALEAAMTRQTGEQSTMLEGLRGKRITTALSDLENQAWARSQQEKESQWASALGGEQLRASAYGQNAANQLAGYQTQASVAMSDSDRTLQAAIAEANQANTLWNQQYTTSQDAYQRNLAAATAAQGGVANETPAYLIPGTYEWTNYQNWLTNKNNTDTGGGSSLDDLIAEILGQG